MSANDIYKAIANANFGTARSSNNNNNTYWQDDALSLITERIKLSISNNQQAMRLDSEEVKNFSKIIPKITTFKEKFSILEYWLNKDSKECLFLSENGTTVYRYQLTTSKLTHKIEVEEGDHLMCMINVNNFITVNDHNNLKLWSFTDQECFLDSNRLHTNRIFAVIPYEDTFVTVARNDKILKRWDIHSFSLQCELELPVLANETLTYSVCKNTLHIAIRKETINKNERQNVVYKINLDEMEIEENYWDRNVVSSMQNYDNGRKNIYVKAGINVEAKQGENKVLWSQYYGGEKLTCMISAADSIIAVISNKKFMNLYSLNNFFNFGKLEIKIPGEILDVYLNEHSSEFCFLTKVPSDKILFFTAPYKGKRFCLKKDLRGENIKGYRITNDNHYIFITYEMDPNIYCYKLSNLKFCYKLENNHGEVEDFLIDKRGKFLYVATSYKVVYRWNLRKKKADFFAKEFKNKVEEVSVNKLSISENENLLAIIDCSNKAEITLYDLEICRKKKVLVDFKFTFLKKDTQKAQKINSESIIWYNDQTLAVGWNSLDNRNIYFIDVRSDKVSKVFEIQTEESDYFTFTSDKRYLVTCTTIKDLTTEEDISKVQVWEVEKQRLMTELNFDMKIIAIRLGFDDRTLYLCLASKKLGLSSNKLVTWDLIDDREKQVLLTNCLFDTPRLLLHNKDNVIILKSRKDIYILDKDKIKDLNNLDIASVCLIKNIRSGLNEEDMLKELINHLYVNYPRPFAVYNFHLFNFILRFDYKQLVIDYLNLYGYPNYDNYKDDPLYNCYSKNIFKKQYILDIITFLNENSDQTHLHEETLNKIFESNPSTKEQEFLTNCLFRFNHVEDCELEKDWMRLKSVGLPIGINYYIETFKPYPIEITSKKCGYSRAKLNLENGSQQSLLLFQYLSNCSNDTIMSDLKHVINYKWYILRWWYRGYSFLIFVMAFTMCLNLIWVRNNAALITVNIVLNILFIIFEVKCLIRDPKGYFANGMNWIDCIMFFFNILMVILANIGKEGRGVQYLVVICISVLSMRSMTHLRIFDGTRYLIIMILQVFIDIFSFLVLYAFFVFAYAIIWLEASKLDDVEIDFVESLIVSTNLAFGDWSTDDYTGNQWIVFLCGSVTLTLIMLNFLIAIISETYERVNEDRLLNDLRAKIDIIIDFDQFLNLGSNHKYHEGSYFTLVSDGEEVDPIVEKIEGVESILEILVENNRKIMEKLEIGNDIMKKKFALSEKQILESFKKERQLLLEKLEENEIRFNRKFRENEDRINKRFLKNEENIKMSMSFLDDSLSKREEKLMGRFQKIESKMDDFLDELSDGEMDDMQEFSGSGGINHEETGRR